MYLCFSPLDHGETPGSSDRGSDSWLFLFSRLWFSEVWCFTYCGFFYGWVELKFWDKAFCIDLFVWTVGSMSKHREHQNQLTTILDPSTTLLFILVLVVIVVASCLLETITWLLVTLELFGWCMSRIFFFKSSMLGLLYSNVYFCHRIRFLTGLVKRGFILPRWCSNINMMSKQEFSFPNLSMNYTLEKKKKKLKCSHPYRWILNENV